MLIFAGMARVTVVIMASIFISSLQQIKAVSSANLDLLNEHESIDCSDELSRVATEPAIAGQNSSIASVTKGIVYMAIMIAFNGFECLCVACSAFLLS